MNRRALRILYQSFALVITNICCNKYIYKKSSITFSLKTKLHVDISPETSVDHLKYTCTYHHTVKPDIWATFRFMVVYILSLLFIKTCWSLTQSRFWVLVRTSVQASRWGIGRGKHTWPSASMLRLNKAKGVNLCNNWWRVLNFGVKTYFNVNPAYWAVQALSSSSW